MSLLLQGAGVVAAAQDQTQPNATDAVVHSIIDAVEKHYLHAHSNPLWNIARDALLSGKFKNSAQVYQAAQKQLPLLDDSELNLLTPDEIKAVRNEILQGELGLGLCDPCLDQQIETGRARVVTPLAGSPAMQADIEPLDVIISINDKPTSDMSHEQVMDTLHAPAAASVKLVLERGDKTLNVVLQPSADKLEALQSAVKTVSGKKIGYIRVALFTPDLAQKARDAVTQLEQQGVEVYILDVRNNPGGFLNSAKNLAALFTSGTMGYELRSNNHKEPVEVRGTPLTNKPLAVLINGGTASAAEFLAGGIQGLHRGVLVGNTSYGRGQAQIFTEFPDGYGIQIPSVLLLTPDGVGFKGKGIAPDVEVDQPQLPDAQLAGPRDKQFLRAVQRLATGQH